MLNFTHIAGLKNISDYNSKIGVGTDPVELTNSHLWRHGLNEFCDDDFPLEPDVFLKFGEGKMIKYHQPKLDHGSMTFTCLGILCDYLSAVSCYGCSPIENSGEPIPVALAGSMLKSSAEVLFANIIEYLPVLPRYQYDDLLYQLVRLLTRVLTLALK